MSSINATAHVGTGTEAGKVRDAKEEILGCTREGQGHLEKCKVSPRVSLSLPGGPAEGTQCARVRKHEATWPCAPRSDSENMVNRVRMYLSPVTPAQASLTPPNACDIYGPTGLVWQLPYIWRVLELLAGGCCVSPLFKEIVSHLRTEAVYSSSVSPGPSSMPFR